MVAVMGATGNTGRKIALALVESGHQVRALARSGSRLAPLERAGAEVRYGDAADAGFLASAFSGADAVYTLLPTDRRAPDYLAAQREQGEAIVRAIQASGVRHVVALSCLGADMATATGLIQGLHEQEQRLAQLDGVNVLLLRPVSFFENFFESLAVIEAQGIVADSVAADRAIPMIASRDIAEVAAQALMTPAWTASAVRELLGPGDITYAEATRAIGRAIGNPDLRYVQLGYEQMAAALVNAGLSRSFADLYVEMTLAFNNGRVRPRAGRTAENTTPTQFEAFVDELLHGDVDPRLSGSTSR